jgi:hypothetical protein
MVTRRASCSCGQLNVDCEGEPIRVSMCHCLACQQRTGSAFGVQARFSDDKLRTEGRASSYTRVGDEGSRITFRFCPECGSTISWKIDAVPGFTAVAVGAFADPTFPAPKISVYESRRHAWTAMPALQGIERY